MADTPDDLLDRARIEAFGRGGADDAFTELDALLSSGGPLPAAWATAAKPEEAP